MMTNELGQGCVRAAARASIGLAALAWCLCVGGLAFAPGCGSGHLGGDDDKNDAAPHGDCGNQGCDPGQYCSVTNVCIPNDTCADDADCEGSLHCGDESSRCLGDGECAATGDCDEGMVCDTQNEECVIGGECGATEINADRKAPNVLILLDRSGSMDGDAGGDSRWNVAKGAIQVVTDAYDADIRFGLATYSACLSGGCSAGSIVVAIADDNAAAVNGFLADKLDEGSSNGNNNTGSGIQYLCDSGDPETTTGKSLGALVGEPSLQATDRDNAVLLITDGEESGSCVVGGMDGRAGAAALLAQSNSVRTYVVGLGINSSTLNQIAVAGGTGQLVPADNLADLTQALSDIATDVMSCEIVLGSEPPNPDDIHVFFNDEIPAIPLDSVDGWTYDPASLTITFHGASCDLLKSGTVTDIDVVYGCDEPVVD